MTLAYTDAIGNVKCIMKSFKEQAIDTVLDEIVETGITMTIHIELVLKCITKYSKKQEADF